MKQKILNKYDTLKPKPGFYVGPTGRVVEVVRKGTIAHVRTGQDTLMVSADGNIYYPIRPIYEALLSGWDVLELFKD